MKKIFFTLFLSLISSILFSIFESILFGTVDLAVGADKLGAISWLFGEPGRSGWFFGIPSGAIFALVLADKLIYKTKVQNVLRMVFAPILSIFLNYLGLVIVLESNNNILFVFTPVLIGLLCFLTYYSLFLSALRNKLSRWNSLGLILGILLGVFASMLSITIMKTWGNYPVFTILLTGLLSFFGYRIGTKQG